MEKVSVIIPVYNVENYVSKCLDTVVNQSYKNLEIVIVNDETKDKSMDIVKKFKEKNERIVIVEQKNQGLSGARNTGILNSTGEYIMFVDSDDWLDLDCIEKCVKSIKENDAELILFSRINEYEKKSVKKHLFSKEQLFEKKDCKEKIYRRLFGLYREELSNPLILEELNTAWGKLYKREVIKKEYIDTKIIGTEDGIFNIQNIGDINRGVYIEGTYYHYRKNNLSSLTKTYDEKKFFKFQNMYNIMENEIKKNNLDDSFREALQNRKVLNLFSFILDIYSSNISMREKYLRIKKLLDNKEHKDNFKNFSFKYLPLEWKIFYKLCKYKMSFFILIMMKIAIKIKGVN